MRDFSREAERLSRRAVPDTCPAVDAAAAAARGGIAHEIGLIVDAVKEQTEALRAALTEAIEARLRAEYERDDLRDEVRDLSRENESLRADLEAGDA